MAAVDPKPSFRLTPPLQHRLALADEASELHHEELETASRFVPIDDYCDGVVEYRPVMLALSRM